MYLFLPCLAKAIVTEDKLYLAPACPSYAGPVPLSPTPPAPYHSSRFGALDFSSYCTSALPVRQPLLPCGGFVAIFPVASGDRWPPSVCPCPCGLHWIAIKRTPNCFWDTRLPSRALFRHQVMALQVLPAMQQYGILLYSCVLAFSAVPTNILQGDSALKPHSLKP